MVGHSDEGLEWQSPVETGRRLDNRLGRIPQGLGSSPSNAGLWSVQERKMQMGSPSGMNFVKL